jgi:UDP-N-acetylmuramate--alanine ligase
MFRKTRHIHLIAIGGIGMSGIAEILLNLDFEVSGSDLHRTPTLDRLAALGARIHIGHHASQIEGADVVVHSSAISVTNPEITGARELGIPVIRRAEMLAELMRMKYGVAVAGSHGKTTTTSLIADVLAAGKLDPTVLVGGRALATGQNAVLGAGEFLVAEADESDGTFLRLTPTIAVVTNIDYEHVDFYEDMDALRRTFAEFLQRVPFYGTCILCLDDPEVRALIPAIERHVVTYGLCDDAVIRGVPAPDDPTCAEVYYGQEKLGRMTLPMPGRHNLLNALAAVAVGLELDLEFKGIAAALAGFAGVGRRYEAHGEHGGVTVVDDYGHHPTEVAATLTVAAAGERRLAVLFQPHRYSRTRHFAEQFAEALGSADLVGLLPIYPAGETAPPGLDSHIITNAMPEESRGRVTLLADHEAMCEWLQKAVQPGDLLLTLGAGDVGRMVPEVCAILNQRPA